jgi:hypothetical protein
MLRALATVLAGRKSAHLTKPAGGTEFKGEWKGWLLIVLGPPLLGVLAAFAYLIIKAVAGQ